jgi:hypothetical protein
VASVSENCKALSERAPRNVEFGELDGEVVLAPLAVVDHAGRPETARFHNAVVALRWSNLRLTRTVRLLVQQERLAADVAPPAICADLRDWAAGGFRAIPADARRVLEQIRRVDAAEALLLTGQKAHHVRDCQPFKVGRKDEEICSGSRTPREAAQGHVATYKSAPAAIWRTLGGYASGKLRDTIDEVRRMELALVAKERAMYAAAATTLTRELGLDPAILELVIGLGKS